MKSIYASGALLLCFVLAACGSSKAATSGTSSAGHAHKPSLDVSWQVAGTSLTVTVDTDLHISPEHYGQGREDGEGHIHMYLDDQDKIGVKERVKKFDNLPAGPHKLKVSLHNNDHTPYDVTKTFEFEIK
jgi:hypothetical protein